MDNGLGNLTDKGLKYTDENGDEKLIPRCNYSNEEGYKYSIEDTEKKEHLMMLCIQKYPNLEKGVIELLVDRYMNHPDDMIKEMKADTEYMKKFKI
tara:strand:+ start:1407 stop:1694 length:288 start_codon:yes stop_codon:yes gene_type:complete